MAAIEKPVRLSIIGAGIMGERLLRAAQDHAEGAVQIVSVWDAAPEAIQRLAPLAPPSGSAQEAIEAADCVYIATPPASHLDYADRALGAGRAVFLEKPLATDIPAAEAFVRRHGGARIAVNFPFASSPAALLLRSWLDDNVIGAPRHLDIEVAFARWPRPWQQAASAWLGAPQEGGFTREVVSHFLFLARRLLGPLQLSTAAVRRIEGGAENKLDARLSAGALPVTLSGNVGGTELDDHNAFTLTGTGAMRLRDWSWAERQRPDGTWAADPDALAHEQARPLVLRRQLEAVAAMTCGAPHRLATLQEALEVQVVVESILAMAPLK